MNRLFASVAIAFLALVCVTTADAQQTDLQAIRTIVTRAPGCTLPPNCTSTTCLRVVVKNNGPNPYGGTFKTDDRESISAGTMRVTVDIDEPGKPGTGDLPRLQASFTQDFLVTIPAGDSVTVNFGPVGFMPSGSTHKAAARAIALPPHFDPNPGNDEAVTIFNVTCNLPATSGIAITAIIAALAGVTLLQLRRRRRGAGIS